MAKNNSLVTLTYQVKTQEELDRLMNACQVLGLESGSAFEREKAGCKLSELEDIYGKK